MPEQSGGQSGRMTKEIVIMKYIAMIVASFNSNAALQSQMEDACVDRWGFCLN